MKRCMGDFDFDFDAFFMGPRRRRGGGRKFRWKIFERGDLKFVILRIISDEPMHGYDVMKALEKESAGMYRPSPGSVYPTLQMLEDEGYLTVVEADGKKVYHITDEGKAYLDENSDVVDEVFDRVDQFADRFFGGDMKDLSSSFKRLASITFDEAFRWGTSEEVLAEMRGVLEDAADRLEEIRSAARAARRGGRSRRGASSDDTKAE